MNFLCKKRFVNKQVDVSTLNETSNQNFHVSSFESNLIRAERLFYLEHICRAHICCVPCQHACSTKMVLWMRPEKLKLSDVSCRIIGDNDSNFLDNAWYILNGVPLMQIKQWAMGQTFDNNCQSWVNQFIKLYGTRATVVVEGYHDASTMDRTRLQRTKYRKNGFVNFTEK